MLRLSILLSLVLILSASSVRAAGINSDSAFTSQYIKYRSAATKRSDPRLKHLPNSSKKANKCLQYMMGVCTLTEPEDYGRRRYSNKNRGKVKKSQEPGFQSAEYWSN